jgi:hypothetical protein
MGKYEPLTRYLSGRRDKSWDARFSDVERVLGFDLPRSAYEYPAWWANQDRGHSQTRGWRDAGWETGEIDLASKTLVFRKSGEKPRRANSANAALRRRELIERAMEITGIADQEELIDVALTNFIHREAGRQLAAMGGTMPDFEIPPRRRIEW